MASKQDWVFWFTLFLPLIISLSQTETETEIAYNDITLAQLKLCGALYYTNTTSVTLVSFDRIAKALHNTANSTRYKIITKLLEKNLHTSVPPHCEGDSLFFVDSRNRFTIFNNNTITLFVPPDDAIRFEEGVSLQNQIVMAKVDKEAFESGSLSQHSKLRVCGRIFIGSDRYIYVTHVSEDLQTVCIKGVKITQWNVYNDGHAIVHATDDFFDSGFSSLKPDERMNTDEYEVV